MMTRASAVCARGGRAQNPTELADLLSAAETPDRPLDHLSKQICHELRTPLNAVIGFSDVMRGEMLGPVGNARYREYLDHISDSARRLLKAAEDTLTVATLLSTPTADVRVQPLNLHDTVADAVVLATEPDPSAAAGITMAITDDIEIWGDRETLINALNNIITVAIQATPSDQLSLTAQTCGSRATLMIDARQSGLQPASVAFRPPDPSETDLVLLLARALLRAQGSDIDYALTDPDDWHAQVQFEASRQRAMVF